jgi:hypothetical protein
LEEENRLQEAEYVVWDRIYCRLVILFFLSC